VIARVRKRLAAEGGFTLIEALVAIVLMAIGIIAVLTTFDAARGLTDRAEVKVTADAIARGEIQRVEALSWSNLALASTPSINSGSNLAVPSSNDPTGYISTTTCWSGSTPPVTGSTYPCYQWNWSSSSSKEPLVINASTTDTTADPYTVTDTVNTSSGTTRVSFSVYRFITYANDSNCTASACSTNYYKRITVAVTCPPGSWTSNSDAFCTKYLDNPVLVSTLWFNPVGGSNDPLSVSGVKCLDGTATVSCVD
jgi:type II secretory pathway pseudopilin PulG